MKTILFLALLVGGAQADTGTTTGSTTGTTDTSSTGTTGTTDTGTTGTTDTGTTGTTDTSSTGTTDTSNTGETGGTGEPCDTTDTSTYCDTSVECPEGDTSDSCDTGPDSADTGETVGAAELAGEMGGCGCDTGQLPYSAMALGLLGLVFATRREPELQRVRVRREDESR